MDAIKTLKRLIRAELGGKSPDFVLIRSYLGALQEASARRPDVSVRDLDAELDDGLTIEGGGNFTITNNRKYTRDQYNRRQDAAEDQMLSALGQMAAGSTPDPLIPLVQVLPHLGVLYSGDEAEVIRARLRAEIEERLGISPQPAQLQAARR